MPHELELEDYRRVVRLGPAILLASVLLASCASDPEPSSSSSATTTTSACPAGAAPEPAPGCATTTTAAGPVLEFCAAGEEYLRNYEDTDYAGHVDPAELQAVMERGNLVTDTLGAEAPAEVELSIKAVAAAFDKRRILYSNTGFAITTVTPEENRVLAAVEVDVEDSEQRMHDYLVKRCNISL